MPASWSDTGTITRPSCVIWGIEGLLPTVTAYDRRPRRFSSPGRVRTCRRGSPLRRLPSRVELHVAALHDLHEGEVLAHDDVVEREPARVDAEVRERRPARVQPAAERLQLAQLLGRRDVAGLREPRAGEAAERPGGAVQARAKARRERVHRGALNVQRDV